MLSGVRLVEDPAAATWIPETAQQMPDSSRARLDVPIPNRECSAHNPGSLGDLPAGLDSAQSRPWNVERVSRGSGVRIP